MNIPRDKTVQDLFKWRVEQTPDLVAHKFLDRETSYKELDLLSIKLRMDLLKKAVSQTRGLLITEKIQIIFLNFW